MRVAGEGVSASCSVSPDVSSQQVAAASKRDAAAGALGRQRASGASDGEVGSRGLAVGRERRATLEVAAPHNNASVGLAACWHGQGRLFSSTCASKERMGAVPITGGRGQAHVQSFATCCNGKGA